MCCRGQKIQASDLSCVHLTGNSCRLAAHIEDAKLFKDMIQLIIASSFFGFLVQLCGISPLFGYIMAGIILGPSVLNRIKVSHFGYPGSFQMTVA
jgi:hypothetical protein